MASWDDPTTTRKPDDIAVELYSGRLNAQGDIVDAGATPMRVTGQAGAGAFAFSGEASCLQSGRHGYTVRVRPANSDLAAPLLPGFILWAHGLENSPDS